MRRVVAWIVVACVLALMGIAAASAVAEEPSWWEECEALPSEQVEQCFREHNGEANPDRALVARSACNPVDFVYRPHAFGISCDRTMAFHGIHWKSYGGKTAAGTGRARTQGCTPSCANGEVRWLRVTVRLHKQVTCGGRPVYARLTYRLHGRIIPGFRRHVTLRMIAVTEYGEPICAG